MSLREALYTCCRGARPGEQDFLTIYVDNGGEGFSKVFVWDGFDHHLPSRCEESGPFNGHGGYFCGQTELSHGVFDLADEEVPSSDWDVVHFNMDSWWKLTLWGKDGNVKPFYCKGLLTDEFVGFILILEEDLDEISICSEFGGYGRFRKGTGYAPPIQVGWHLLEVQKG